MTPVVFGQKARRRTRNSVFEEQLAIWIERSGFERPIREFRFTPLRMWRFDFAWPARGLAIEIEGGTFMQGRHSRGVGIRQDAEKYNEAALLGWTVIRVTTDMFKHGEAYEIVGRALRTTIRYQPTVLTEQA